ncbi:MAG TPA: hypothetical protein VFK05_05850 [Polyangiaceae bacterium]|nr:hypothetical protein [Polyangiaceae bacterium]
MDFLRLSGLWLVPLSLLGACSGHTVDPAQAGGGAGSGGGSSASSMAGAAAALAHAGSSGDAGAFADAGSPSSDVRNPDLLTPPDDGCDLFHITEAACMQDQCPPWPCAGVPKPGAMDWPWCVPVDPGACLGGFDCAAAQAAPSSMFAACLMIYHPCRADADCDALNPYCVIDARYESGSCESGEVRARCRADDDCKPGTLCIAVAEDGTRGCSDGTEGGPCNLDAECQGKRCIHAPGIGIVGLNDNPRPALVGICSTGEPRTPCFMDTGECPPGKSCTWSSNDGECVGNAHCVPDFAGPRCTAGNLGDPCSVDSDCKSHYCPTDIGSVCTAGAVGDRCTAPEDCETGFCAPGVKGSAQSRCTTGEVGESCLTLVDCKTKRCDRAPNDSQYSSVCSNRLGASGEFCQANADCESQQCGQTHDGMLCVGGNAGDLCHEPSWCTSGFCVLSSCSNGALGDRCVADVDCVSQHCVLDSSQGFPVCSP